MMLFQPEPRGDQDGTEVVTRHPVIALSDRASDRQAVELGAELLIDELRTKLGDEAVAALQRL